MRRMNVANDHDEPEEGEGSWLWPLHALIALIASLLDQIAKLKRIRATTKFKPTWRDHWQDLRQCEWLRDQVIAHGLASLLAGKDLDLDAPLIMDPPDDYGASCPRTPFAMNQRFLAIARWTANPEAIIRERYKRLVKRLGRDPLAVHGSTHAAHRAGARHELEGVAPINAKVALILNCTRGVRASKDARVLPAARAPPTSSDFSNATCLSVHR